jgi:hypothetical protein
LISLIPKRTLAACACTLGAGAGASAAFAGDETDKKTEAAERPVVEAAVPVVKKQLTPPSGEPTKGLQERYLKLHKKARKGGEKPGRNVVKDGVKEGDGDVRLASAKDVKKSVRVLKRMTAPKPEPSAVGGSSTQTAGGAGGGAASPQLESIAACESGGDPSAVGGGGQYRGKYQFSQETWASVGGSGDPAAAPEAEQDKRAAQLLSQGGAGHWPVCSK